MSHDPHMFLSQADWRVTATDWAEQTLNIKTADTSESSLALLPRWFLNRTLKVFWEPDIPTHLVQSITDVIGYRLYEMGMSYWKLELCKWSLSMASRVEDCSGRLGLSDNRFFERTLIRQSNSRDKYGSIIITNRMFVGDVESWGSSSFDYGVALFALAGNRQSQSSLSTLQKVVGHEIGHLFGIRYHCDDFQNVEGYMYDSTCNMHYSCDGAFMCPKCRDYVTYWWQVVDAEYPYTDSSH